ncbi:histidine kinase dimerization/phosphoacceptor domain -containing protein [Gracilinema caldarium]|uniref:histidine kinase n=1 Tax=Gracilinema caldarium (strain ATCC 51460 / DSM 7334 / H1) TaxID=744872 RepID=F8EXR3_GRAC1|nr:histidine kinase dimerization/phosphoacceptor domain -containing protein [Gracilinema caldarium]AEJ20077.1 signal transduction histidine kinase [Gracilinema caldarium DSM 7334]
MHNLLQRLTDTFFWLFSRGKLKRTLFGAFSVLLAFVFAVSWFISARGLRAFSDASIQDLAERSSRLVFEQFSAYLENTITLLETDRILFEIDPDLGPETLLRLFKKELESFRELHIIAAGFNDGEYAEVQRMEDGSIRYGRAGKETGGDLLWFYTTQDGAEMEHARRPDYDPRKRPWYQNAIAAGHITFSEPYHLVSTGNQVIAASLPLYKNNGTVRGVITVDILLDDITKRLNILAHEFSGYVIIRNKEGKVLINANQGKPELYTFFPEVADTTRTLYIQGEPYRFITLEYQGRIKTSWLVTVALPETAFRTQLVTMLSNLLVVYIVALIVFFIIVYGIVTAVNTPIRTFTELLSRLSFESQQTLNFSPEEERLLNSIAQRKTELGSLARSFRNLFLQLESTLHSLKQSLTDKDILLKEVHHRVKNNLQVIVSLLHLEADGLEDEHTRNILVELEEKVYAMSMVHETVYTSGSLSTVPMAAYLSRLSENLASYHSLLIPIFISVDADDVQLPLERAIPCALIIVELVTNAFKYAFSGKSEGHITIGLHVQDDFFILAVQDDGCGFHPKHTGTAQNGTGTGSIILEALTSQIRGTLSLETGPSGTTVKIHFPFSSS